MVSATTNHKSQEVLTKFIFVPLFLVFYKCHKSQAMHSQKKNHPHGEQWTSQVLQSWTTINSLQHIMMVCVLIAGWLCTRWQWTNGERCHLILWGLYSLSNINIRVLSYITRYYLASGYNTYIQYTIHMTTLAINHIVYQLLSFGGPHNTKSAFSHFREWSPSLASLA